MGEGDALESGVSALDPDGGFLPTTSGEEEEQGASTPPTSPPFDGVCGGEASPEGASTPPSSSSADGEASSEGAPTPPPSSSADGEASPEGASTPPPLSSSDGGFLATTSGGEEVEEGAPTPPPSSSADGEASSEGESTPPPPDDGVLDINRRRWVGSAVPALRALTSFGFGAARKSTEVGYGAGRLGVQALSGALEGPMPGVALGLRALDTVGLAAAERLSMASLGMGESAAEHLVDGVAHLVAPAHHQPALPTTSALKSLVQAARGLRSDDENNVSFGGLLYASRALSTLHHVARSPRVADGGLSAQRDADLRVYANFAVAAYGATLLQATGVLPLFFARGEGDDVEAIAQLTTIAAKDVLRVEPHGVFSPLYYVALHGSDTLVVAFRGTASAADCLTDCVCEAVKCEQLDTEAHAGMLRAALEFVEREQGYLEIESRTRQIVLTGHSLGAGVATLVAALWRDEPFWQQKGQCFVYGPPCTLADPAVARNVVAVAIPEDAICSTSYASLLELRDCLRRLADDQNLCDRILTIKDDSNEAFARAALRDLRLLSTGEQVKLRPGGRVFFVEPRGASIGATPLIAAAEGAFDDLLLSGDIFGSHLPVAYLRALLDYRPPTS